MKQKKSWILRIVIQDSVFHVKSEREMKFSNSRNQCNYLAGFAFFVELAKAYPFAEFLVGIDLCGKKKERNITIEIRTSSLNFRDNYCFAECLRKYSNKNLLGTVGCLVQRREPQRVSCKLARHSFVRGRTSEPCLCG